MEKVTIELGAPLAGWCLWIGDVPDPVFAEQMMGPGIAIDPTGDRLHAPCDATVLSVHPGGHAVTLKTAEGVELLLHIGIDTVSLKGEGFEPLVGAGDRVARGDALIRFDLDRLVQLAPAMATPLVVTGGAEDVQAVAAGRMVGVGEPVLRVVPAGATAAVQRSGETVVREMRVGLPHGLHARPSARIGAALRGLDAEVTLIAGGRRASAASSVALLGLALGCGESVTVEARGTEALAALDAVEALLAEEIDAAPEPPVRTVVDVPLPEGALAGIAAAPGLVVGRAHRRGRAALDLPVAGEGVEVERARLSDGIARVEAALAGGGSGPAAAILAAHRALAGDPGLRAAAEARIAEGAHAATAFVAATDAEAARLCGSTDRRIAERADDLVDVGRRVAAEMLGVPAEAAVMPAGSVLVADDLLPSELIALDASALSAIVLRRGGATSHVAILAAGMGVPMLVALGDAVDGIADGALLVVDGDAGHLLVDPDVGARKAVETRIAARRAAEDAARAAGDRPTATACGTPIGIYANLGSVADAEAAAREGAEGCGLLRTEFLFLDRPTPPDEREQTESYAAITRALGRGPMVVRLLDIGGDKPAPYLDLPAEENPALGERGVRVLLNRPGLLEAQARAILSACEAGDVRVMAPMIVGPDEFAAVRDAFVRVADGRPLPPLGVMIETPAAALVAGRLAEVADFFSIGSNDLAQYALAMDRGNAGVAASADGLHPAVLRLIDLACRGAESAGRPVGVCGGLAADPLAVPILLGLGVASLSVPPVRVPATKALVAATRLDAARTIAARALDAGTAAEVRALARAHQETRP